MIEHPEAVTIAGQIDEALGGKKIESATRGNSPHKFAFYSRPAEEYASILPGKTILGAKASGSLILVRAGRGHVVCLGGGGERITLHQPGEDEPKKHQLLIRFRDQSFLSVRVQGWGSCQLWTPKELNAHKWYANRSLEPTDEAFTYDYFTGLFDTLKADDAASVKFFLISDPGVWGIGNGYLQDILHRARIHPRTRAVDLTKRQRRSLFSSINKVIAKAIKQRGRTDETDIHGERGGYERVMSTATKGEDCPACGEASIEKANFLGGAIYTCPACQPVPTRPPKRKAR